MKIVKNRFIWRNLFLLYCKIDHGNYSLLTETLYFAVLCQLYHYRQKHPLNFVFLGLFTVCLSLSVGWACANTQGYISSLIYIDFQGF